MVYTMWYTLYVISHLWYTMRCDISWYIVMVYTVPWHIIYHDIYHDIYHVIYQSNIYWYIPCDIPCDVIYHDIYQVILMCDIPYKTVIYHPGIYHGIYHIWHHTKLSKPICTYWGSNPQLQSFQDSVLPTGPCISLKC